MFEEFEDMQRFSKIKESNRQYDLARVVAQRVAMTQGLSYANVMAHMTGEQEPADISRERFAAMVCQSQYND